MRIEEQDRFIYRLTAGVIALVFAAAILGFILVPVIQGQRADLDVWASVCRALGIQPGSPSATTPQSTVKATPASLVAWNPEVLASLSHPDPKIGQQLAQDVCSACHGATGISPSAQFPHLAGQSAMAIYKQLHDFRSGARVNEQMTPVAQQLTEEQMTAVADHYASLVGGTLDRRLDWTADPATDHLVRTGDVARAIPGCQSCHGAGAGGPMETPTISHQYREYLALQLDSFANGTRHNDVFSRMRTIASQLTPEEIDALARYYSTQ